MISRRFSSSQPSSSGMASQEASLRAPARDAPGLTEGKPEEGRCDGGSFEDPLGHGDLPAVVDLDADELGQLVLVELQHLDAQPAALVDDHEIRDSIDTVDAL